MVDSLKALDPNRSIREADIDQCATVLSWAGGTACHERSACSLGVRINEQPDHTCNALHVRRRRPEFRDHLVTRQAWRQLFRFEIGCDEDERIVMRSSIGRSARTAVGSDAEQEPTYLSESLLTSPSAKPVTDAGMP